MNIGTTITCPWTTPPEHALQLVIQGIDKFNIETFQMGDTIVTNTQRMSNVEGRFVLS